MSAQFFDKISREATGNIMRFLSKRPLAKIWISSLLVEDAKKLCYVEDAVG